MIASIIHPLIKIDIMKKNYKSRTNIKRIIRFILILFLISQQGQAQILEAFEMDGDAQDGAAIQNDAQNIYTGTFNPSVFLNGFVDYSFLSDGVGTTDDVFVNGASKDGDDITDWRHETNSVPDKNQLLTALGATYIDKTTGHPMLYVAVDRYSATGAASMGFWFLAQKTTIGPDGRFINSETGGFASHEEGDILIVANFPQNGSTPEIVVYTWENDELTKKTTGENNCSSANAGDPYCGSVNTTSYPAPWPYTNKDGSASDGSDQAHLPSLFLEVSIDLEALFGTSLGCFSTFVAASRASTSESATLKDLAVGTLKGCDLTIEKAGATLSKEGDKVTYNFKITNPGTIPLQPVSLIDDVLGDITADLVADGAALLRGQNSVMVDYEWTVPAGYFVNNNPLNSTVVLTYAPPNGIPTSETVVQDNHTLELFKPSVTIEKTAVATAKTGDKVTYSYTITNTTQNSPTLGAPDLVLSTSYSDPPVVIGQGYEDVGGNFVFTGSDVFVGNAGATEGNNLVFDVVLSHPATGNVTVNLATTDGTASSGSDYTGGTYSVNIPAGNTAGTITIPTLTDTNLSEANKFFTVAITSVTSTSGTDTFDDTSDTGTGTVINAGHVYDDVFGDLTAAAIAGGCGTIASGASCTFTFDHTITLTEADLLINNVDMLVHPEGFPNDIAASDTHSLDILPILSITNVTHEEGDTGTTAFTFTVTLDRPNNTDITLDYATVDATAIAGTDYTSTSQTGYTITAGTTSFDITVNVLTELLDEIDETFLVTLSNLSTNAVFNGDVSALSGTGTITNDDIDAIDDDFTANPISGLVGGVAGDVTTNDKFYTVAVNDNLIDIAVINDGGLTGVTIDGTGAINVPSGTPSGTYNVLYSICETGASPVNCDQATATVLVLKVADLDITITVNNATPAIGSNLIYTITLTNQGPDTTTNVKVESVLPSELNLVSSETLVNGVINNSISYNGSLWDLSSLTINNNDTLVLNITVTLTTNPGGPLIVPAEIITSDTYDIDSVPGNNN